MRDRILINKNMIPYKFTIKLCGENFAFTVMRNKHNDLFTVKLEKNGEVLCESEPVIYGVPLFKDIFTAGSFPAVNIVPYDESGENNSVTYENFNKTVFLIIDNGGDEL